MLALQSLPVAFPIEFSVMNRADQEEGLGCCTYIVTYIMINAYEVDLHFTMGCQLTPRINEICICTIFFFYQINFLKITFCLKQEEVHFHVTKMHMQYKKLYMYPSHFKCLLTDPLLRGKALK